MNDRPLSPHLQTYRLPLTAVLSITHRITGILLSLGMVLLVVCLMAIAQGATEFALVQEFLRAFSGRIFLWLWIYALFFHLSHGVRHLIWDTGHGFERASLDRFAGYEIIASIALTAMVALIALFKSGGTA